MRQNYQPLRNPIKQYLMVIIMKLLLLLSLVFTHCPWLQPSFMRNFHRYIDFSHCSSVTAVYFHFWGDHTHRPACEGLWIDCRWTSLWPSPHCMELYLEPTSGAGEHVFLSSCSGTESTVKLGGFSHGVSGQSWQWKVFGL